VEFKPSATECFRTEAIMPQNSVKSPTRWVYARKHLKQLTKRGINSLCEMHVVKLRPASTFSQQKNPALKGGLVRTYAHKVHD
jgi:hypothetical protein